MTNEREELYEQYHYLTLLEELPAGIHEAFMLSPMFIGADSEDLIHWLETIHRQPVTEDNYRDVAQQFRQWYKETYPDEYHDPPTAADFFQWRVGGWRPEAGRKPNDGNPYGRQPLGNQPRKRVQVNLAPDLLAQLDAEAEQLGLSRSELINQLLAARTG